MISAEDEEQLFNDPTLVIRRRKVGKSLESVNSHLKKCNIQPQRADPCDETSHFQVTKVTSASQRCHMGHVPFTQNTIVMSTQTIVESPCLCQ